MLICVDPGHGGKDPGAVDPVQSAEGDELRTEEDDLALDIAVWASNELQRLGHEAVLTRGPNQFISLSDRCRLANRIKATAFVSIHLNAGPATAEGFEVWSYPGSKGGALLRDAILAALGRSFPTWRNRGAKTGNLAVLRETVMPAALVECGFITNPDEERRLHDSQVRRQFGEAIARGVVTALDVRDNA